MKYKLKCALHSNICVTLNRLHKLLPGPQGLPLVGYLPFMKKDAYIKMTELGKKYGSVFSFKCGQFDNDNLLAHPDANFVPGFKRAPSFIEMSSEPWKQQRQVALTILSDVGFGKIALTILRNVGLGKNTLADKMKEKICNFLIRKHLFNFINRLQKLPPGPWGLPFVGYFPSKYGPVFSFKCGQCDVVVINEVKAIEEAFKNDQLLARPNQRRVALTILRNVGLGKSTLEEKIKEEIIFFIDSLKSASGKEVDFSELSGLSVANNVSILLFGHRFEYDDPIGIEMQRNMKLVSDNVEYFSKFMFMPSIFFFVSLAAKFSSGLKKVTSNQKELEEKITEEVTKHKEKKATHEIEDYIDGYLQEMDKHKDSKTSFNIETLRRNTADFYAAGSDTTTNTLSFMMLYLITYPEYQRKIRDEIKQIIGFERQPDYADRTSMPFTMAFIYESLRMSTLVHKTGLQNTELEKKITDEVTELKEKKETHEIQDYIDGFLQEMYNQKDSNTTFTMNTLRTNTATFYSAGSDTTTHMKLRKLLDSTVNLIMQTELQCLSQWRLFLNLYEWQH
uniref:Cytochrome P450 n=1 Tax=Tetranychus urticae TaxID=32264 RepID=T1JZS4_TETUR